MEKYFIVNSYITLMSKQSEMAICYLCKTEDEQVNLMVVPMTTGGNVHSHIGCLKIYMNRASQPSACNGCSGNAGCC